MKKKTTGFGLIIVGNEILEARREDVHFKTFLKMLTAHNLKLLYTMILPDEPDILEQMISWAMKRQEPFFCCGGIGATPDDYTRQCAAKAVGVRLVLHPEGVEILKAKFGDRATPERLRMVEFPEGCELVPNPYNQIPGFAIKNGYFLPGFPEMAGPMGRWVVENIYESGDEKKRWTISLPGAKEADLVPMMESFVSKHPSVSFSSLPMFTTAGTTILELSISGHPEDVDKAKITLKKELGKAKISYNEIS